MKVCMAIAALALTALAGPVRADETIAVGGETLFVLKADSDLGKTAQQRASDCYDRLRDTLGDARLKASDIQARPMGAGAVKIVARGRLIVPIGADEAKAHGLSVEALGKEWVATLGKKLPALKARPDLTVKSVKSHPVRKHKRR